MSIRLALCLIVLSLLIACGGTHNGEASTGDASTPASGDSAATSAPSGETAHDGESSEPAPFGVMSSRDDAAPPVAAPPLETGEGQEVLAPGAAFTLPEDWIREAPSSQMRLAQARIPGSGGDAELTVFYFGPGGGGGVEANLERWIGQVDIDPGTSPQRDGWATDQLRVTWVDVTGTLKPSTMGTGPSTPQPDSRLLGAVIEGAGGPWFFKATGPSTTLDEQREAFLEMLKSARVDG